MSERPSESSGLTSGDPLGEGEAPDRTARRGEDEDASSGGSSWARPADRTDEVVGGYTSAPPPGAYGGAGAAAVPFASGTYRLAGWWSRVGAALIDGLIIGVGGILLLIVFGAVFSAGFFASDEAGVISLIVGLMLAFGAFAIVSLLYAPWMMARTNGRTLGRMAMNIRVVRADGRPMTLGLAMLREVAVKWLLFGVIGGSVTFGLSSLLDVLWPLWDEENRALHDFIVNTRTIVD
jgi:uncharacterized RDD family membrane protein YckC